MSIDALPLSLYGPLTSIGSYKKSYTSITSPLALGAVEECWRVFTVLFGQFFLARFWCLEFGLSVGVYPFIGLSVRDFISPTIKLCD